MTCMQAGCLNHATNDLRQPVERSDLLVKTSTKQPSQRHGEHKDQYTEGDVGHVSNDRVLRAVLHLDTHSTLHRIHAPTENNEGGPQSCHKAKDDDRQLLMRVQRNTP